MGRPPEPHLATCGGDALTDRDDAYEVLDRHPDCTMARVIGGMNQQLIPIRWATPSGRPLPSIKVDIAAWVTCQTTASPGQTGRRRRDGSESRIDMTCGHHAGSRLGRRSAGVEIRHAPAAGGCADHGWRRVEQPGTGSPHLDHGDRSDRGLAANFAHPSIASTVSQGVHANVDDRGRMVAGKFFWA
jgi:hypothetical protein